MAPSDILVEITLTAERPARIKKTLEWPPHIGNRQVVSPLEGLPARIGEYSGTTRVGAREVFFKVFFGRTKPTGRQLRRANAELRRAHIA